MSQSTNLVNHKKLLSRIERFSYDLEKRFR